MGRTQGARGRQAPVREGPARAGRASCRFPELPQRRREGWGTPPGVTQMLALPAKSSTMTTFDLVLTPLYRKLREAELAQSGAVSRW